MMFLQTGGSYLEKQITIVILRRHGYGVKTLGHYKEFKTFVIMHGFVVGCKDMENNIKLCDNVLLPRHQHLVPPVIGIKALAFGQEFQ
jgi:hypothetical protein